MTSTFSFFRNVSYPSQYNFNFSIPHILSSTHAFILDQSKITKVEDEDRGWKKKTVHKWDRFPSTFQKLYETNLQVF